MILEKDHSMAEMPDKTEQAANFLKGIASHHRLAILCQLANGEKCVTDIMKATGIAQTSMSQHLSKLKQENIIALRRDHRTHYYSIKNSAVLDIMAILYKEFCEGGDNK